MICETCVEDTVCALIHSGCRADEATCIDGRACPDFIERCDCLICWPYALDEIGVRNDE